MTFNQGRNVGYLLPYADWPTREETKDERIRGARLEMPI